MKKNLLIGNGINQCSNTDLLSADRISDRFYLSLKQTNYLETETEIEIKSCLDRWLTLKPEKDINIEKIANNVYNYIKDNIDGGKEKFLGSNNEYRLKKILTQNALNAIFIQNNKFITIDIDKIIKDEIPKYDNIYTLNYHEYWDDLDKVKYLHGKIKLVTRLDKDLINPSECIFSIKDEEEKSKVDAVYPSENLFPAEDLYTGGEIKLYEELNKLDHIVIFGVSPYADRELMNKIKNIKEQIIFVYDNNKAEIEKWKENIGESIFLNSSEFKNHY